CISDGRIVPTVEGGRTIDATGLLVFPGGVDVHTHVAGAALNFARGLTPEHMRQALPFVHTPTQRAGLGGITPTTFATGYLYAGMGWTTVNEAAVPLLSARHTHEELHDTPIVDKSCLVLMANNEIVLDLLEQGEVERARHVVAWLISAAKAYGVKAVNPGGIVNWKFGRNANRLAEHFNAHPNVTTDAGAVLFGDAVTITADGPWQHLLHELTGHKWGNLDVENETGCGIVPYVYKERNLVNAVQWAVGLELLLLVDDPWRVFLTTDHP